MVQNFYVPDGSKWSDEDIVISGISARLPNCDSVEEFQSNLLAKVDLITDEPRRFQNGLYGAIKRYGLLKDLSKFDAEFFGIHPKQAERMDPQIRNLLEVTYEATVDAGLHPEDLKGTRTGVIVGIASSETQDKWSQRPERINGYEYVGCTRTMFANRVSYFFDIKGPSYSIDTASSTTLVAFQQAYDMIRDGICDACFVCGTDLVLNPCVCLMFQCLNMLSPEGKCKAFDNSGDGYVRSEGVIAVLLQKARDAKRVYANVLAAGSNCDGYKNEGITFPSCEMQVKLFRRVAEIAGIDPKTIDFMEAHGSATRVGDPQEMNAVTEVFTRGREVPLRTGSVKSNMGHGEPASALSAVIKICVAMECGILPPNLHYKTPNPDIPALLDGRLQVITEPTPWTGGLVAVNSFGVGGANGHALLLSNKKRKQPPQDDVPRLVCVSGVTESAVTIMLNKIKSLPVDHDLYGLLYNIHRKNIKGHAYRGFTLTNTENIFKIARASKEGRQTSSLSIVFPGLETTWTSLSPDVMKIKVFRDSIAASEKELSTVMKNVNLNSILFHLGTERSLLNQMVGVTALQIGLVHILRTLEIIPHCTIGINTGEIVAGYSNGAYTLRQAMLLAYNVGKILKQFYYPSCVMKSAIPSRECNPPVDVSTTVMCGSDCTLFSGPKPSMDKFVQHLKEQNYECFASDSFVVDVIGIIRSSGRKSELENEFNKILKNTTETTKWSAGYLINALTRATKVNIAAEDPVVLEVGPASGIYEKFSSFAFMKENRDLTDVLISIGQLFNVGLQPQIQNLYPKTQFPVPHSTPMIQSMIEWDHSQTWDVVSFAPKDNRAAGELEVVVDFDKEEYRLLKENEICGQEIFPRAFYIYLLWKTISRLQNKPMTDFPLIIENIFFIGETSIPTEGPVKFTIVILQTSNKFEIREGGHIVVSGEVWIPKPDALSKELIPADFLSPAHSAAETNISATDVYRFLSINKYRYNSSFKSITSFDYGNNTSKVKAGTWISHMEAFFQILILNQLFDTSATSVVSFIRKIVISSQQFRSDEVAVHYSKTWNVLTSEAIQMRGVKLRTAPLTEVNTPNMVASKFVPFFCDSIENAAESSLTLAVENFIGYKNLKIVELLNSTDDLPLTSRIKKINPFLQANITVYYNNAFDANINTENTKYLSKNIRAGPVDSNAHLIIARNVLRDPIALENSIESVCTYGCLLLEETSHTEQSVERENIMIIARLTSVNKTYYILKKVDAKRQLSPRVINVTSLYDCTQKLQHIIDDNRGLLIVARRSANVGGIVPFVKSISAQAQIKNLSVVLLEDEYASSVFSLKNPIYSQQLQKEYPINVYKNGIWGSYITTSLNCGRLIDNVSEDNSTFDESHTTSDVIATNTPLHEHQLEDSQKVVCKILYTTVNRRDVELRKKDDGNTLSLSSTKNLKHNFGLEFSGYEGSRRVFGLVRGGTFATSVIADKDYLWTIPENWTFEEAATVPYAYALSYYGLKIRGNLQKNSSILIEGFNDIAIAAVSIAFHHGCKIFLLLKDEKQIPLLRKSFPRIENINLIVSNENNFHLTVLQLTAGKGVQLLFNTVKEDDYEIQSNVFSLAENGVYVYLNHGHFLEENLGSSGRMRCLTFHRITISCLFDDTNVCLRKKIGQFIADGLKEGVVQPFPFSMSSDNNTLDDSSFVPEECNTSKVVMKIEKHLNEILAENETYFDSSNAFIVLAGNTDFGAYATANLITLGVQNLVLINTATRFEHFQLSDFLLKKATERTSCNISRVKMDDFGMESCETLIQNACKSAPLGGIFDFTQFGIETLETPVSPDGVLLRTAMEQKVNFLSNMDLITRKSFPSLRYFVSFSVFELEYGQPEYEVLTFANGMIQTLMRSREDVGLNGTLIQWGKVGESLEEVLYNDFKLLHAIIPPQPVMSCLKTMNYVLKRSEPVVSSFLAAEYIETRNESKVDLILEGVAKFLGIKDPNSVRSTVTLLELGLDSLIGTDIQQFLQNYYDINLSTQEVRELTFEKLKSLAENM